MSTGKKILVAAGAVVSLALLALLVLPFVFKDRVAARARTALDDAVAAHVDWSHLGLGFFRHFPNLTVALSDLSVVTPPTAAAPDTIASVGDLSVVLDLGSVWRAWRAGDAVVVRSVQLDRPRLNLRVGADGRANWDVLNQTDEGTTASGEDAGAAKGMTLELHGFDITHGDIAFRNDSTGIGALLAGLDYTLSGNFSLDEVVARTTAHADEATVTFGGVPYLNRVALDFRANVDANFKTRRFSFQDNELRLNDLAVQFAGEVAKLGDDLALDLSFEAPQAEFSQALSLVPALYANDFSSLETQGNFTLKGDAHGKYGPGEFPAFQVKAAITQGQFRYPDLPLPAKDISLDLSLDNPGGGLDNTVVRFSDFHVVIGDQPVDASILVRTPVSDPDVDAKVTGTVDLADMSRTVKLPDVQELTGVISADAAVRARLSDIDGAHYDRVDASGTVQARNVAVRSEGLRQPVQVQEMTLALSPKQADLRSFSAQLGSSDIQARGHLDNVLAFALKSDEPLRGDASFTSKHFVLDEWRSEDPTLEVIPVPAMLDLTLSGTIDRLDLGNLQMDDARGSVTVKDQRLTMKDFTLKTLGGRIGFNGFYDTTDPAQPTFDVALAVDSLDVGQAAANILTVRTLAPVASYAAGRFSTDLKLTGALKQDLTPVFDALDGNGILSTSRIAIEGFPLLQKLSEAVSLPRLSSPTFDAIRSSIEIRGGRLHVKPFRVGFGDFRMSIEGSNGIDKSLDYKLGLVLPRAALGAAADQIAQKFSAKAAQVGVNLAAADSIRLGVGVGGTINSPSLDVQVGQAATSVKNQLTGAATEAVTDKVDAERERVDSATAEARRRAQARADSVVADAQRRADQIRAEAKKLADGVRAEGEKRAQDVLDKATNPITKRAAQPVADRIRKEANDKADGIEREADQKATALVDEARKQADQILAEVGAGG